MLSEPGESHKEREGNVGMKKKLVRMTRKMTKIFVLSSFIFPFT